MNRTKRVSDYSAVKLFASAHLKQFKKVSTIAPVWNDSLKYPVLYAKHLRSKEFVKKFKKMFLRAQGVRYNCDIIYTSSKVTISYSSVVTVSVYYPQDASISVNYLPLQDPIDFILYICSSFGIWFGVSVLSCGGAVTDLVIKLRGKSTINKLNDKIKR